MWTYVVSGVLGTAVGWVVLGGVRVINQVERGVVFRFGKARRQVLRPGLAVLIPLADRLKKVNVQIVTMPVPTQEGITRDNVSVRVDAVVYFRVSDPLKATIEVQDHLFAVAQVAQTSLRSIIGKSELDDLLSNREELHRGLEIMIDSPALGWGVHIDRVEIKDVQLPESMKRSMSRQAEAERERRARVITADGEFQAARKLADASAIMSDAPAAMQLRLLQTVVEVAAEKNSTLVMPFPVELLRFFDRATRAATEATAPPTTQPASGPVPHTSSPAEAGAGSAGGGAAISARPAAEPGAPKPPGLDDLNHLLRPRDPAERPDA